MKLTIFASKLSTFEMSFKDTDGIMFELLASIVEFNTISTSTCQVQKKILETS